jgi:HD-GYP domain-containing protein (c-di-GMP phosphodiesterase class II)
MNSIPLSFLQIGKLTEREYYTQDGELLISQGITLSQQHLDALQRRKIDTVFMKDDDEDVDGELKKLISADFKDLEDLHLEDPLPKTGIPAELSKIKPGREGLQQLLNSTKTLELDSLLQEGKTSDMPVGQSLKSRSNDLTTNDRTEEYKNKMSDSYNDSLRKTKNLLDCLAIGQNVSNEAIRSIVLLFVETYLTDKNILLNLSTMKPSDGDYIYQHSLNVCILSINIAAANGYNEQQVIEIGMGALLHDVGMLLIPKTIRLKNSRLAESEWFDIQKHPMLGLHLLEKIDRLPVSVPFIAYQTHERENGKGYPKQRSNRLIHNFAKVVAVADIFEALSSPRMYREGNIPYKSMESLIKMTRQGLISGELVKSFLEYTSLFPVGSIVELSNGYLGKVIKANGNSFAKPVVCVFANSEGEKLSPQDMHEEDLSKNITVQIVRAHASTLINDVMLGF